MSRALIAVALSILATAWDASARGDDVSQGSTYHADAGRSGNFTAPGLTWAAASTLHRVQNFGGRLVGHLYAQPLYWRASSAENGMVITVTDQDVVQAFDSQSGAALWQTTLGTPATDRVPKCGNGVRRQTGVLGTPVIDPASGTLYVFATTDNSPSPEQFGIWAISLATGAIVSGWPLLLGPALAQFGDSFTSVLQDQHGALALSNGTVYAGFAANHGDCVPYNGWVVSIDTASATLTGAWQSRVPRAGVWAPGGIVSDGTSLFYTTGNAIEGSTWQDGEAVFRAQQGLAHATSSQDYFAAANFVALDSGDLDLGGNAPIPVDVPVSTGGTAQWLLQFGKDGTLHVLDRTNLGGVGGELLQQSVAQPDLIGAPAQFPVADGVIVALAGSGTVCSTAANPTALLALKVSAQPGPVVTTQWCSVLKTNMIPIVTTTNGSDSPIVWVTANTGGGRLFGYRGDTGAVVFGGGASSDAVPGLQRHSTLLYAEGRIFAGSLDRLYAFTFTLGQRP